METNSFKNKFNKWDWPILPLVLFLITFFFYFLQADFSNLPVLYPDSSSYLQFAREVMNGSLPDTLVRTPVYPLLILPFLAANNLTLLVIFQILLAAGSVVLLYLTSREIIQSRIIAFFISVICILDYNYFQFQYIILAELASGFILLCFIYISLGFLNAGVNIKNSYFLIYIILSLLIIFIKPVFVLLPFMVSLFVLVYFLVKKKETILFRRKLVLLSVHMLTCLLFIFIWSGTNYIRYGHFTMSRLSKINMLSKVIQYGYPARYYPDLNEPEVIRKACSFVRQHPNDGNPFPLILDLDQDKKISDNLQNTRQFEQVTSFFLWKNPAGFTRRTVQLSFRNIFRLERSYYLHPREMNPLRRVYDFGMDNKHLLAWFILLNIVVLFFLYKEKRFREFFIILLIGLTFYYVVFMNCLTWFEYSRLIAPAELLLDLLIFYPLLFMLCFGVSVFKNIPKYP